ncbi:LysR family transcriptional regulator [Paraburkholderia phenazinium]|jgi:DNA-binding transcriptional LysR family regulator|uniref:DNA-binding transcriptional regulator, LysR family n=1 Tax=Paraburkholderia phenazinium TaxID=60549 RepID=A0A1G8BR42_9BURK|nr:LysR family transcriptional regulator [Paraburkholderia phenazinium]SDH35574.1 DNA-binding transcriptional regulator, LysR family [Paraburkholderia phenazinium]
MDRLTSMAVFVKAAETGSFTAAAAALGISSQMVGKHIRFLEARYGMQLINRTTRRQSLTEAGHAFFEGSKAVLLEANATEALAANLLAAPRGKLKVNAPVSFGAHSLTPMVAQYLRQYPEVQVDLTLSDRVVDLVDEGYDAVIRIAPLTDSGLIARQLAPYRLVTCAAPAYLAERGIPSRPEDLTNHECLGFAFSTRPPMAEWEFVSAQGVHTVRVTSRFSINNGQGLRSAALAGLGIIQQPREMLNDDLASGRLVQVLPAYEAPARPMYLLFAQDRRPTPKLRSFVDFVVAAFG